MALWWAPSAYDVLPPHVKAARAILQDWFRAMEDGTMTHRQPDPLYPVAITVEQADEGVAALDREYGNELRSWASREDNGGYTDGPGFSRLAPPQRLALAQALHAVLRADGRTRPGPEPEPAPMYPYG